MEILQKYTYMMDVAKIKSELERLWERYQKILENPNWEDLNEARAILYLTAYTYCEEIATGAIERRLHLLEKPLEPLEFYHLVDSDSKELQVLRNDALFNKLEQYYLLIKNYKNKFVGGKLYLDEEKFIELYNQYIPSEEFRIRECGKFDKLEEL